MERSTKKIINLLVMTAGIAAVIVFVLLQMETAAIISLIVHFAVSLVCSHMLRCPHCGRWPSKRWLFEEYCPRCGEHLE